jgi:signal transduction histidine kinase/CheY-like chemotaxis protein
VLQNAVRIRSHLLLLTVVVLLPGFLAAGVAVDKVREGERKAALVALRETVRSTALLVDGQVLRSLGALTALGNSANLDSGDLAAFYKEAKAIDEPPDVWTLLLDETGMQKINTAFPFGARPPLPAAAARVDQVLATRRPLVTDVFSGPATNKLLTTIYVPAAASSAGRYVVAQAFSVEHWKKTAMQPSGRSDWIVAVIDRQGKFISRSHRSDELLGRGARPELVAAAAASNEGLIRHRTLEGVEVYDSFIHSTLTGWTIAVAAPVDSIEATATQAVLWLTIGIAGALVVAVFSASFLSRFLIQAMETASAGARALGAGQQPAPPRTTLDEVNGLNVALIDAGHLLSAERSARKQVEVQRERLLVNETAARERAQSENAAKDKFLALLGHELRNPLSAIAGATEVLVRKPGDEPTAKRFVAMIQRQNIHLRHIVDDLLETSRMLSGKIVLDLRPLDLAECVAACVDSIRATARAKDRTLTLSADRVWVRADPIRIEQIVNNLVTNALKFSPSGSEIVVKVQASGDLAVLEVSDAGVGIAPDLLPRIFEPFVQGSPLPGEQASGLGVGLSLVKQLVELHGGEVRAISTHTQAGREPAIGATGATFIVTMPRIESASASIVDDAAAAVKPAHVLLVEDNPDAREATAELMRAMGHEITEAEDGEKAIATAARRAPDIVVMDLGLPGKSGYQIATEFRKTESLRHVPLIALSGYGQDSDRQAALAAGFDEHLVKPVESQSLSKAIQTQLDRSARQ